MLKQGEFVGSLDCGTTYASPPFINYILIKISLQICSLHYIRPLREYRLSAPARISSVLPTSWVRTGVPSLISGSLYAALDRWHDHDPLEIQEHSRVCIEESIKLLEANGWSRESVKVVGTTPQRMHLI